MIKRALPAFVFFMLAFGAVEARAQSPYDELPQAPPSENAAPTTGDEMPELLADALTRTTLDPAQWYAFEERISLIVHGPGEPETCSGYIRFRPQPRERGADGEIVVTARRPSRENDWHTEFQGPRQCVRLLESTTDGIRTRYDFGDAYLYLEDPALDIVGPFTIMQDDAQILVIETHARPNERTLRGVRRLLRSVVLEFTIDKQTRRVVRVRTSLSEPRRILAGLGTIRGMEEAFEVGPLGDLCCVRVRGGSISTLSMLGMTMRLELAQSLTWVEVVN